MVYVNSDVEMREVNFLKSEHLVPFTRQADETHAGVVNGVLPAGSVWPANDGTAQGITYNSVDVSKGPQPVSVIFDGHILKERLPEAPTDAAYAAMMNITLYDAEGLAIAKTTPSAP